MLPPNVPLAADGAIRHAYLTEGSLDLNPDKPHRAIDMFTPIWNLFGAPLSHGALLRARRDSRSMMQTQQVACILVTDLRRVRSCLTLMARTIDLLPSGRGDWMPVSLEP